MMNGKLDDREQQPKQKLVLVGNGMAGMSVIEQIRKLGGSYDITVIGKEPVPNYNRIQLSYVLEGTKTVEDIILNPLDWYEENQVGLILGDEAERIDTKSKRVYTAQGRSVPYDKLILATGSVPFVLPIPGAELGGVIGFRDIADCDYMIETASKYRKAAVIGGGLLGLEAAKGLVTLGMDTTVVHLMGHLMERQLDPKAGQMLKRELEAQGIKFKLNAKTVSLSGEEGRVSRLHFADGTELEADLVIMAAGIRPNTALAARSGLEVKRGIAVDDYMVTSHPDIYAVGECCEHRGQCYGLVAPLFEQGTVLAKQLCGLEPAPYLGSSVSTRLKISGVDVFSAGEFEDAEDLQAIVVCDEWNGKYKKLMIRDGFIVGGIVIGETAPTVTLSRWVQYQEKMTAEIHAEWTSGSGCCGAGARAASAETMAAEEIVCGCNGVTKGAILSAIHDQGMSTVEAIKNGTGATRSCGGCKPLVEQLLQYALGGSYSASAAKETICSCTMLSRDEVVAGIRDKRLTHGKEVMHVLGWMNPEGCSKCRPAVNYYLGMVWPEEHTDEKASRFVNERLHANIQKDGTFSVIPRMYGGVTSPQELRKIADTAEKFGVEMVKVTGGQRIDLLGVSKENLPLIWAELDMPSGYGYAKSLRTVKTCVGSRFCRFGTQDSIGMGIALEKRFERLNMPAKFKMAVNGCPRNCAESGTKDLGIVGNDGGWEIYIGGNGGIKLRAADLLCKVKTDEELEEITGAFIQYYREEAKYGERTSDWVERVGLSSIVQHVVDDMEEREALNARVQLALGQLSDPWGEVLQSRELQQQLYGTVKVELPAQS